MSPTSERSAKLLKLLPPSNDLANGSPGSSTGAGMSQTNSASRREVGKGSNSVRGANSSSEADIEFEIDPEVKTWLNVDQYDCELCLYFGESREKMLTHMYSVHKLADKSEKNGCHKATEKSLKTVEFCELCSKDFAQMEYHCKHTHQVSKDKFFKTVARWSKSYKDLKCPYCENEHFSYASLSGLMNHLRKKHELEDDRTTFRCRYCLCNYASKKDLDEHFYKYHYEFERNLNISVDLPEQPDQF